MASKPKGFNFKDTASATFTLTPDGTVVGIMDVEITVPVPPTDELWVPLFDDSGAAVFDSDGGLVVTHVPLTT